MKHLAFAGVGGNEIVKLDVVGRLANSVYSPMCRPEGARATKECPN